MTDGRCRFGPRAKREMVAGREYRLILDTAGRAAATRRPADAELGGAPSQPTATAPREKARLRPWLRASWALGAAGDRRRASVSPDRSTPPTTSTAVPFHAPGDGEAVRFGLPRRVPKRSSTS